MFEREDSHAMRQNTATSNLASCRALGIRQAAEYAPWSVAVDHIVDVYRYLLLQPTQSCAAKWATFVRNQIVDPTLGNNTQLALNASQSQMQAAQPDIQSRLLRPLLASLSNEFNDSGARAQAQTIFQVGYFFPILLSFLLFCELPSG